MSATTGNLTTASVQTAFSTGDITIAHNHDTGSDGIITVFFILPSAVVVSGVTYDSVSMTQETVLTIDQEKHYFYTLANPSTGTNDVVINTDTQFQTSRQAIQSFTEGTVGSVTTGTLATTSPATVNITATANSVLYVIGMREDTNGTANEIEINSVGQTEDWDLTHVYEATGSISGAVTSGSKDCDFIYSGTSDSQVLVFEILEVGGGGAETDGNFFAFF